MAITYTQEINGYPCIFERVDESSPNISLIGVVEEENPVESNSITIPSSLVINDTELSIVNIGDYVNLPNSISGIIIDNGISSIGNNTFSNSKLQVINIPESVTSIGTNSLTHNVELTLVTISPNNSKYKVDNGCIYSYTSSGGNAIYSELILCPASKNSIDFSNEVSSISAIGPFAFAGCTSITNIINIPDNVLHIKERAFYNCTELKNINIGKNINSISESAFIGCTSIFITVSLENSKYSSIKGGLYTESNTILIKSPSTANTYDVIETVKEIKADAFYDNLNISYINFLGEPPIFTGQLNLINGTYLEKYKQQWLSVIVNNKWHGLIMNPAQQKTEIVEFTYIIENNEIYITGLANTFNSGKLSIPPSINDIDVVGIKSYAFANINTLTSIILPPTIKYIEAYAFYNCTGLITAVLPVNLNIINTSTFFGCASLTNIELPSTLLSIYDSAFYGCVSLSNIKIPETVLEIENLAFYGCENLINVEFLGKPPLVPSYDTFPITNGTYLETYKSEWENVIFNGEWNNITLTMVENPIIPTPDEPDTPTPDEPSSLKNNIIFRIYNKQVIFDNNNNKITNPTIYIAGLVLETDNKGKEYPVSGLFINDNIKLNSYVSWESRGISAIN